MRKQEKHPYTEIINAKQKNLSRQKRQEALSWLAKNFPQAFDNTQNIRPLKKGIMDDILKHEKTKQANISSSKLREAVVIFARRIDYLITLKSREMRIDLEGNIVEPVSEDEAMRAAQKIKKMVEKSVKNSRKTVLNTPGTARNYSSRGYNFEQNNLIDDNKANNKTPAITIKNKTTRNFDPTAVLRLKEKLGLAREKETV